ncbi:MAG TPA: DUF4157 domain-containing protein [Mycobacteriales bacterium]|nr:DUF4157 domain-containing protein [Mycobacteriales bacterium]
MGDDRVDRPRPVQEQTSVRRVGPAASSGSDRFGAGMLGLQVAAGNRAVGRWLAGSAPPVVARDAVSPSGAASAGLVVEDGVEPEPHQQRRGEFLATMRAAVLAELRSTVAGTPWDAPSESEVDAELSRYAGLDAAGLEQAVKREVPAAAGAASAGALVAAGAGRVRAELVADLSGGVASTVGGLAGRAAAVVDQVAAGARSVLAGIGALFNRRGPRIGGSPVPADVLSRLGPGQALDGTTRAGMQHALGADLSGVRVHSDTAAAGLAEEQDARAFAVGRHVAFGPGEYQPGTVLGDALLAHELAHVVQQDAGDGMLRDDGAGAPTGVEEGADRAAAQAVRTLWGVGPEVAPVLADAAPPARGGARPGVHRCKRSPTPAPTEHHNLPSDTAPLSAPGEQVLFGALYQSTRPLDFEMIYVAQGAAFDASGGPTSKTIDGLAVAHQPMFIPADWTGTPITVEFKIRRKSDAAIVATKTWTFGKKRFFPTTLLEFEHGPQPLSAGAPTSFVYQLEPQPPAGWTGGPTGPYYQHETVLERFEGNNCNVRPEELTAEVRRDHPDFSSSAAIAAFFFAIDSFNASFTVDRSDAITDMHSAGVFITQAASLMRSLTTPKAIEWDLVQVYEVEPGKVLARYVIRRRLAGDGRVTIEKIRQ